MAAEIVCLDGCAAYDFDKLTQSILIKWTRIAVSRYGP